MSLSLPSETVCKAKDPSICRNHGTVAVLEAAMAEAQEAGNFDAYYHSRASYEMVRGSILLEEEQDYETYDELFAENLESLNIQRNEIKKQLLIIKKNKTYSTISWDQFAKWSVNYLPSQSYGPMIEANYIHQLGHQSVPKADARGDFLNLKTKKYTEFKVSAAEEGTKRNVNFVQIRPHHKIDDYHMVIVDKVTGKSELFIITKEDMTKELEATNWTKAHGTTGVNNNVDVEYAIRFKALDTDTHYKRWLDSYAKPFPLS